LYHVDPSGTKTKCRAKSIGSGSEGAQTSLNEEYREDLTLEEAETMAMSTLKAVMEEKVNVKNVDFAVLKSPKFQVYDAKKIQEIIDRAA
jgi:20S proteasome subunit alpha 5